METQLLQQEHHDHSLSGPGGPGDNPAGASGASISQQLAAANELADASADIVSAALSGNSEFFVQHFRQAGGQ